MHGRLAYGRISEVILSGARLYSVLAYMRALWPDEGEG